MSETKFTLTGVSDFDYKMSGIDVWAENVSDGFHTMDELYDHRMALNIALFNSWYKWYKYFGEGKGEYSFAFEVMKSKLHNDGTMFDGYFIVMAITPTGQISYHYKLKHWDKFNIPEVERTPEYDGHTSMTVIQRLVAL